MYSILFDGTGLKHPVSIDVSAGGRFRCPSCVMSSMVLSPSSGSGILYMVYGITVWMCENARQNTCNEASVVTLFTDATALAVGSLQLEIPTAVAAAPNGAASYVLYYGGALTTGNSIDGWPGFLKRYVCTRVECVVLSFYNLW